MANGQIIWHDLTVNDAKEVRDFYQDVLGWTPKGIHMGDYEDYVMSSEADPGGTSGLCEARGANADMPPQWMMYVQVESVATSCETAIVTGGEVVVGPRQIDGKDFAVIKDPAGAVLAIIEA